jgi:hypothetical protein
VRVFSFDDCPPATKDPQARSSLHFRAGKAYYPDQ